jgi:peptidoglycan/xylan/chitin deacetylase (PgdA/CDA1 family)
LNKIFRLFAALLIVFLFVFGILFAILPLPGTVPILMYHFIGTDQDAANEKNYVSRESFARHMDFLHRFGYRVITMEEFYDIYTGKRKPQGRELVITFDDGNPSFEKEGFPILKKYALPATLFLISESIKQGLDSSMSERTIKQMKPSGLITIASHTKTHPSLPTMSEDQIREELIGSKRDLEKLFGIPIQYIAYPFGDLDARVIKIAEEAGYRLGFTTSYKKLKQNSEGPWSITRIKISRTSDSLFLYWAKISGIYQLFKRESKSLKNTSSA